MIRRTDDAELVNRLVGDGTDMSEFLAEPLHVCLVEGDGGAIFAWRGPDTYEVHLFLAERGRAAIGQFTRMLATMRRRYGARRFWALVPHDRRKVRLFARWMGWKSHGVVITRQGLHELFSQEDEICPQQ